MAAGSRCFSTAISWTMPANSMAFYSLNVKEFSMVLKGRLFSTETPCRSSETFLGVAYITNPTNVVDWIPPQFLSAPGPPRARKPVFRELTRTYLSTWGDGFEPGAYSLSPPWRRVAKSTPPTRASAKILLAPRNSSRRSACA